MASNTSMNNNDGEWIFISGNSESVRLLPSDTSENIKFSKKRAGLLIFVIFLLLFCLFCRPFFYVVSQEPYLSHYICNSSYDGQNTTSDVNTPGFDFTLGIIIFLFFLRCIEAWIILVAIFKYFFMKKSCCMFKVNQINFKQLTHNAWEKIATKKKAMCLTMVVILIMVLSSVAVVILELDVGLKSKNEPANCRKFIHWSDFALDMGRYTYDLGIRILMIVATLAVKNIWDLKEDETEENTNCQCLCKGCFLQCIFTKEKESDYTEPTNRAEYDRDRKEIANHYRTMKEDHYEHRGDRAKEILKIFSTWFIIPWVVYFIEISLDADDLLKVWKTSNNEYEVYNMPQVAFFVYNINQIILLLVPYLCSHIMNAAHRKYVMKMRSKQLEKYHTGSRKAFATLHKIERNEDYDFSPRVWFTKIEVCIEQPFYALLLLLGLFFALSNTLIK